MSFYLPALLWALILIFFANIEAKPQDPSIFEDMAKGSLMAMGNMAEMASNGALISKNLGFELPFAKANSETQIGFGGAMTKNSDNDDDSSEELRRKRSLDLDTNAPCHMGTTGGGGGTGTDDVDVEEARRRMYNRLRQAASKRAKKTRQTAKKTKKKYFSFRDGNNEMLQQQASARRKRQTEVDDLNAMMTNSGNDFSQKAQQFAEKVRNLFDGFMKSMNEMAQRFKQKFTGGQTTTTTNNEEV